MIEDLRQADGPLSLTTDICIAGAGAAGITLARALAAAGREVVLLESGGRDFDASVQDLADGEVAGEGFPYYPLREARLRFFGGTTAIWGGRSAELDAIDFEARAGVPLSGWPITHAEMAPWYADAWESLGLTPPDAARIEAGLGRFPLSGGRLDRRIWQFDDMADRFGIARAEDLLGSPRIRVLLNATVAEIALTENGGAVERVGIRSLTGQRGEIVARRYVLALGGIETPRMLLAARDGTEDGPGGPMLGRCFMEHPHGRGGVVRPSAGAFGRVMGLLPRGRIGGNRVATVLRLSETAQREEGLLNSSLGLAIRRPPEAGAGTSRRAYAALRHTLPATRGWRGLWRFAKGNARRIREATDPAWPWVAVRSGRFGIYASLRAEQAPNPESRITLSAERDALGAPKARLDWRLTELDRRSARRLVEILGDELAQKRLGTIGPEPWLSDPGGTPWHFDEGIGNHALGGYHHMGTTRMADDPKQGVTDRDGRVHGIGNLWIAGSSLFPTGGWANPTLTILALAHRLAAHLGRN